MMSQNRSPMFDRTFRNSAQKINEFRILSLGHRGVGKTVFLVGAYVHLLNNPEQITIESHDVTKQNIQKVLKYIKETGQYPPATATVSNFNFEISKTSRRQNKLLYNFSFIDIPGELAESTSEDIQSNLRLQELIISSHACCAFFDASALVKSEDYLWKVSSIINQLSTVASIAASNEFAYPIAIVFTKCDSLGKPVNIFPVEERAEQIIEQLNAVCANYKKFYSAVQIIKHDSEVKISSSETGQSSGGAAILWLLQVLSEAHSESKLNIKSHLDALTSPSLKEYINPSTNWKKIRRITLAASSALVLLAVPSWFYNERRQETANNSTGIENSITENLAVLRSQPNNLAALINLVNLYIQAGENQKAIPVMEKLIKLEPESNEWKLNLARLYLGNGQTVEAEKVYDQILKSDKNNVTALKEKAALLNPP